MSLMLARSRILTSLRISHCRGGGRLVRLRLWCRRPGSTRGRRPPVWSHHIQGRGATHLWYPTGEAICKSFAHDATFGITSLFVSGIHQSTVDSPRKVIVTRNLFLCRMCWSNSRWFNDFNESTPISHVHISSNNSKEWPYLSSVRAWYGSSFGPDFEHRRGRNSNVMEPCVRVTPL